MTVGEIVEKLSLAVAAVPEELDREVTGGYASDLLSCVMAKAQPGNLWITLQAHPNIVAVASLLNLAGIVVTEGVTPDAETVERAVAEKIPLMTTPLTTFTVVARLAALGVQGVDE